MHEVELPDGHVIEFPDDTPDQVITSVIAKNFPQFAPKNAQQGQAQNQQVSPEMYHRRQEEPDETGFKGIARDALKSAGEMLSSFGNAAYRYGVKDPYAARLKFGQSVANIPHNAVSLLSESLGKKVPHVKPHDYSKMLGIKDENIADTLIQMSPELATSAALPEMRLGKAGAAILSKLPKAGKYINSAIGNALSQGLYSGVMSDKDQKEAAAIGGGIAAPFGALSQALLSTNPKVKAAARLASAGAAGIGAYELGNKINSYTGAPLSALITAIALRGKPATKILKGIEGTDYKENLEAAKRLGLTYLTPAEASKNPFMGQAQGSVGKTGEAAQILYQKGQERLASEQDAIKKLKDTIYNPEVHEAQKDALYQAAYEKSVPTDHPILKALKSNENYKAAIKLMKKTPAFREKLKGVPVNSVEYLNQLKKAMDVMAKTASTEEKALIDVPRKELIAAIDSVSPEYKEARQIAQRKIARSKIEKMFNRKDESGNEFERALKDKEKYADLVRMLKNVPEAKSQLSDMRKVFGDLIPTPSVRTAAQLTKTGMWSPRNAADALGALLNHVTSGGKYDKDAVKLITSYDWEKELAKMKTPSKAQKAMSAFAKSLAKPGAHAASVKKEDPLEIEINQYKGQEK